jgi:anti-sigma factor RsiW
MAMSVNEIDFDTLQTYVDGELPPAECEGLWRRLAVEPELSAALNQLRADVAMRQIVWSSMEPTDLQVVRVESDTLRAVRRQKIFNLINRASAIVSVAAACILFGFTVGWLGHERYLPPGSMQAAGNTNPNVQTVSNNVPSGAHPANKFVVNVHDSAGNVVASQTFDTLEEAQNFANDVNKAQAVHQDARDPFIVPVSGHF